MSDKDDENLLQPLLEVLTRKVNTVVEKDGKVQSLIEKISNLGFSTNFLLTVKLIQQEQKLIPERAESLIKEPQTFGEQITPEDNKFLKSLRIKNSPKKEKMMVPSPRVLFLSCRQLHCTKYFPIVFFKV